jgi:hypothetical protein
MSLNYSKDNVCAVLDSTSNGLLSPSTELINDDTQRHTTLIRDKEIVPGHEDASTDGRHGTELEPVNLSYIMANARFQPFYCLLPRDTVY